MFEEKLANVVIVSTLLILFILLGFIVFIVFYQKRYLRLELEKVLLEKNQEMKLSEAVINSQENERKLIGEDLHDDIGSKLTAVRLILENIFVQSSEECKLDTREAMTMIDNISNSIRKLSHVLHPASLEELGFESAVTDFCTVLNKSKVCNILCNSFLEDLNLETNKQLMVFRILQELILNAIKHGSARNFSIELMQINSQLNINIHNDEIKFDKEGFEDNLNKPDSLGLKNIKHRLILLNGELLFSRNLDEKLMQVIEIKIPILSKRI